MNITILEGHLGADPELRYTQAGAAVLNLSLATVYKFKRGDDWEERTDWHRCEIWNKRAEALAKILVKGSRVLIRGNIRYGSYEDKDGVKRYTTTIGIDDLELLGGKRKEDGGRDEQRSSRSGSGGNGRSSDNRSSDNRPSSKTPQQGRSSDTTNYDDAGAGSGGGGDDDDIPF